MKLVCDHTSGFSHVLYSNDYITNENFTLVRCNECNLIQTQVDFEHSGYKKYYPSAYYGESKRYNRTLTRITQSFAKFRLRLVNDNLDPNSYILDVGCGQGWILDELRKLGHITTGVEFSNMAAYHAKEVLGLDVRVGDLRDQQFSINTFDCIIIWHVLEHTPNPEQLFNHILKLLKPGGLLLLAVPDYSSIESKLTSTCWFHLDPPRHLSHFEKPKLKAMFKKHNVDIIKQSSFVPEYDFFSIIQSILNKFGLQKNVLYGFLRSKGNLSIMNQKIRTRDLLISFLLLPVLIPFSIIWVLIVSVAQVGATQSYLLKTKE